MVHQRRVAERAERRRRIQEVAREVIAAQGFAGSSIEQIARAAQISVGAIYMHFRSKDDLCVSLVEGALTQVLGEMASGDAPHRQGLGGAWARLTAWIDEGDHAQILRLLAQPKVRSQLSDEVATAVARGTQRVIEHLATCVRAGSDVGRYRPVDAVQVAELLWALLLGYLDTGDMEANLGRPLAPLAVRAQQGLAIVEHALAPSSAAA
ncbi:MAG: TetR/AcrR family transcriptional regulator [Myxococcales bacterium]|nr:TetR/AcrR family transcriptional regulator [Myxococcales bacterium]HRC58824.1 helix-turn-helix domain-containing protein [Kofleriaceae bacterium]